MKKPKILVVGSINMDLTVTTEVFPKSGETVTGVSTSTASGGKGANQAVAASLLGADVTLVGKVGKDAYGKVLVETLRGSGVDVKYISTTEKVSTGVANIILEISKDKTDNRIIVVPGANYEIMPEDVAFLKDDISNYDIVILQQEIPAEINLLVARYAKASNVPVMLNPAPYREIDGELLKCLSFISPNETEVAQMTGVKPDTDENIKKCIDVLKSTGVSNVLITLGKRGCVYSLNEELIFSNSVDCGPVVDTTAAGDSFVAAFCTALSKNVNIDTALRFANCTAGITVSHMGAQPSLPNLDEVKKVMLDRNYKIDLL